MSITEQDIRRELERGDPYLFFNMGFCYLVPKKYLPYINLIMKESEWLKTPIPVKRIEYLRYENINLRSVQGQLRCFSFFPLIGHGTKDLEIEAIETRKKYTLSVNDIYALISLGCKYEDFAGMRDDIKFYCEALKYYDKANLWEARAPAETAYELRPNENDYANLYFEIGLELGDETIIEKELVYYQDDIDSSIHTGRAYEWIKLLTLHKEDYKALTLINCIYELLDDLISGKRKNKRYGGGGAIYEKEKFVKKMEKTRLRLEKRVKSK